MRKPLFILGLLFVSLASHAQWTTGTGNINNTNTGNVGIGTTTPTAKLSVNGVLPTTVNSAASLAVGSTVILADAAGSYLYPFELQHFNTGHSGRFQIVPYRRVAGNSWQGTGYRMQYVYDVTGTGGENAFIEVGSSDPANPGGNFISLATGGVDRLSVSANGNIGIGTTAPTVHAGYSGISTNNAVNGGFIDFLKGGVVKGFICGDDGGLNLFAPTNMPVRLWAGGNEKMTILAGGNIGIGTTTPDEKLSVVGTVHAKAVKVDLTNLPDYVFDKEYQLTSLEDIKNYIDKNHHLPEMPSAQQVEKEGMNLGEMNKLLLKKVEELTLHLIDQHDRNKQQQRQIQLQQDQVAQLKELINKLLQKTNSQ